MPGQSLLKATLLKETYRPLIDFNGAERNLAVHALPSRLSSAKRRFLDLKAFPVKELQEFQQIARLPDAGLPCMDLIYVYEKLIADAKEFNSYTRVAIVGRNSPPKFLDFDRSARLSISPSEILSGYRNLIVQEVVEELEERSRIPRSDDWEQPSGNKLPTVYQPLKRTERNGDLSLRIGAGAANGEQPSVIRIGKADQVTVQTVSNGRNHNTGADAHDEHFNKSRSVQPEQSGSKGMKIEAEYAISSGSSEVSDCDQEKSGSHDDSHCSVRMSSETCGEVRGEVRSTLESRGKTLSWRRFSESSVSDEITGRALSMPSMESKAIENPGDKMAGKLMAAVMPPTVKTEGEKADSTNQLQARKGAELTVEVVPPNDNSTRGLAGQDRPSHKRRQSLSELLDGNLEAISESIEDTLAECHNDGHKLGFLKHFEMFGKSRSMKERTTSTAARQDLTSGFPEASDSDQISCAKFHADNHQPLERCTERPQRSQTMKESTVSTVLKQLDLASSPRTEVCGNQPLTSYSDRLRSQTMNSVRSRPQEGDQILSPKSHDCSHQPLERSSERHRRNQTMDTVRTAPKQDLPEVSQRFGTSQLTKERTALAAWQSPLDSYQDLPEVSKRLGRSQSTKERTALTAWQSSFDDSSPTIRVSSGNRSMPISFHDYFSTTTVSSGSTSMPISFHSYFPPTTVSSGNRSRKPAVPPIASKTLQKLQQMLGKGTRIQPVVDTDREKANSLLKAQRASFTLRDGLQKDSSSLHQLRDETLSPVISDNSKLDSKTGFFRTLKKIFGSHKGELRIDVIDARLDGIAEKEGHKISILASSLLLPVEDYKSHGREPGFTRFTGAPKRISPQRPSPRRTSARSPRSSTKRRLSPKHNIESARYRKPNVFVGSNVLRRGLALVREDRTETEEAGHSASRNRTLAGQPCGWTEDRKVSELWRNSILAQRLRPRATSTRFRREYVATQRNSARQNHVHGN